MELKELHGGIMSGKVPKFMVFTGEEHYVQEEYIREISKRVFGGTNEVYYSVPDAFRQMIKPGITNNKPKLFVVYHDKEYLKEEKAWEGVKREAMAGKHTMIMVYDKLDKRGKFYNKHKDAIVDFDRLSDGIIIKHLKEHTDMSENGLHTLVDVCGGSYGKIMLLLDQIKAYATYNNLSDERALVHLLDCGFISQPIGDITFKFTDSIALGQKSLINQYLYQSKLIGEPEILTLSVLYNTFRQVLMVQGAPNSKSLSEATGLTPFQIKLAKDKTGCYSISELKHALRVIQKVESGIKSGKIDADIAVEYVILNIL